MNDNPFEKISFTISIIFLIFTIILIIIFFIYYIYFQPELESRTCSSDSHCLPNEFCQAGLCTIKSCQQNSDCGNNITCINGFCNLLYCNNGNDCPTGTACSNNFCLNINSTCVNNNQCPLLTCQNQKCVQCSDWTNCPTGQGCFNGVCRYPYEGNTGPNLINFPSLAQERGNVPAPSGYFCPSSICSGQSGITGLDPISCGLTGRCPNTCPYCVEGLCRCTQGAIYETCRLNSDCLSGLCELTKIGRICVPIGDAGVSECAFNHDQNDPDCLGCCPVNKPYCSNGVCSESSLNAFCGATGQPVDLCYNSSALGKESPAGLSPDGMGFSCVNGRCQNPPGNLNQICPSDDNLSLPSCKYYNNTQLQCLPSDDPNSSFRCQTS